MTHLLYNLVKSETDESIKAFRSKTDLLQYVNEHYNVKDFDLENCFDLMIHNGDFDFGRIKMVKILYNDSVPAQLEQYSKLKF